MDAWNCLSIFFRNKTVGKIQNIKNAILLENK